MSEFCFVVSRNLLYSLELPGPTLFLESPQWNYFLKSHQTFPEFYDVNITNLL